jgi:hypothetical protein
MCVGQLSVIYDGRCSCATQLNYCGTLRRGWMECPSSLLSSRNMAQNTCLKRHSEGAIGSKKKNTSLLHSQWPLTARSGNSNHGFVYRCSLALDLEVPSRCLAVQCEHNQSRLRTLC